MKQRKIKKSLGSYPYVNVIFSISTALFMIGLFMLLAITGSNISSELKKGIEIQVFLNKNLSRVELDLVKEKLAEKEYIDNSTGKARIRFLSKEEGAKALVEDTGEDFIEFLGANPLRDSYIINLGEGYQTNAKLSEVKADIEKIKNVFEVAYTQNLKQMVDDINDNIEKIGMILGIFVVILLFTVVILINNAIKLALFSQRFLIRSMQLVGATPFFIKKPFVIRAVLHGGVSGAIAAVLLILIYIFISQALPDFKSMLFVWQILLVFVFLLTLGGFIGYLSAYKAVSRYLKMRLDELY